MATLVTGAAGFIGMHVCQQLLARGEGVVGLDNMNGESYPARLKRDRVATLLGREGFDFVEMDIATLQPGDARLPDRPIDRVVHLAAQAGVRHSLEAPMVYVQSNLVGHAAVLEFCRALPNCRHLVYASSSSVYGANRTLPFSEQDVVRSPVSLYAATKGANELMSQSYAHLFALPQTGLRFFTVYGPWGRPDMAMWIFTDAMFNDRPIRIFNHGDMRRDFTYVDDIVAGVLAVADRPPEAGGDGAPHRIYNIGAHRSEALLRVIELLEEATGRKAERILEPMQPGDVQDTYADVAAIERDCGFRPTTSIDEGVPRFVDWYRTYHGL